ncbi:nuclease-related domain protein [Aeribacillus phage AP45]|jgi:Nuclease-related domain|uniref:Nuclease-related domain protein n=1 Tax=Aeribacillus phage AP45 TaxID=1913112 RepID=A0A1L2JY40_9CAUD|nr:nuclease-related domain protein [Aeribacillus phage AP45]APC46480.1 nuclease-related domain protein [Aeribacillus phage AP45]
MEFIILLIFALLLLGMYFYFRGRIQYYEKLMENFKSETAATILEHNNQISVLKAEHDAKVTQIENRHKDEIKKLNDYIENIRKLSRNFGEINTHNTLEDIKNNLAKQEKINPDDMIILPNVFIPFKTKDNVTQSRQIDHLVLMSSGIYIIETKYWRGKVLHGLSKRNAQNFSFIIDLINPSSSVDEVHTLVFLPWDNGENGELKIVSYENPENQVKQTAVKLKEFLENHFGRVGYVTPIIYFGYNSNEKNGVVDYSNDKYTQRFTSSQELLNFFERQAEIKEKTFSLDDLRRIKEIINKANYL